MAVPAGGHRSAGRKGDRERALPRASPVLPLLILAAVSIVSGENVIGGAHSAGECQGYVGTLNSYRARHGAAPLEDDPELLKKAQAWVKHIGGLSCTPEHSPQASTQGEMVYATIDSNSSSCASAIDFWYSQGMRFHYTSRPYDDNRVADRDVESFARLIWASSSRVACATGSGRSAGMTCWVAVCMLTPGAHAVDPDPNRSWLDNVKPPVWEMRIASDGPLTSTA